MKPKIAILGAGPTGLEAALGAHEDGFPFHLYEAAPKVGAHPRAWGHVRLFSPWELDISPRARRALEDAGHQLPPPDSNDCPTGAELSERIFEPLADLPAIAGNLSTETKVLAVSREGFLKNDEIGTGKRAEHHFRLLLQNAAGHEWTETADVVLDATGTYAQPNSAGDGGIPAPGEASLGHDLVRQIPDVTAEPDAWANKTTLLIGAGHSAQTAVVALASLAEDHPETRLVWAFRSAEPTWHIDPEDPLPERSGLVAQARDLANGGSTAIQMLTGVVVDQFERKNGRIEVTLRRLDRSRSTLAADRVLALTGFTGDHTLYRQLQVHECYATSGPMKLAAALLGQSSADCLTQESLGPETLTNPEPNFFILGSKSYGKNNTFLMRVGWQQVDEVFQLLSN